MQITDRCLGVLSHKLKNLEHLDLSGCASLSESGFLHLLRLPRLAAAILRATAVTDYVIANLILVLEGLLRLDVSYCSRVSNQSLVRAAFSD